ncbi:MAG TPA: response regulator [Actinoplanes sp.]|jgi:response regulator of citrate/malate metabolism|nr:response regulator [Actinoplanes sp.]
MISVLVVDDDFRVARVHGVCVDKVPGFCCVGYAHTASEARQAIDEKQPDLLLLDIYLPDEDGLSLLRSLHAAPGAAPDCIMISAARDLAMVRSAMQIGAVYYLVKPFGFAALRDQLEAYGRWRGRLATSGEADQAAVDRLYSLLRPSPSTNALRGQLGPTMQAILELIRGADQPVGASQVAHEMGFSRPTAQRHLTKLERLGFIELHLAYGSTGRPNHLYRPVFPGR